jgi:hypothetical protein
MKAEMKIGPLAATTLSIMAIAAILLLLGGFKLMRRKEDRGRGMLMIVAALVLVGNVLIWTWPAS